MLAVVAAALLVTAIVRVANALGRRGSALARVAASLGGARLGGLAAYHGAAILAVDVLQADRTASTAVDAAFTDGVVGLVTLLPVIVLVPLAVLLAGAAAWRAGAGWWVAAVAVAAVVVDYSGLGLATAGFALLSGVVLVAAERSGRHGAS